MFQKTRARLILNNLLVFALVLAGFAIAVRLVFVRNLHQQMAERLTALGQSIIAETELGNDGSLKVEDGFSEQTLINEHQSFEWFNLQGKLVKRIGEFSPDTPLNPQAIEEFKNGDPSIQSVILPVIEEETGELIGYIRVSQLLDDFEETVFQLDVGLGAGVIVAIFFSSAGILWLNRQAMQPIEESFRRLKQFTADASHELRSPLMAITSNVEVALKYPEGMREEDHEAMTAMLSAAEQMTRLTEDLLLLARTDQASAMKLAPLNLSNLLRDVIQFYRSQAEAKQIELTEAIKPGLSLQGDSVCLIRVFTNLLQNAIRYTPAGGKIGINAGQVGNQLQVMIRDTGVGIAKENLENVFERFWRADRARNYDDGGSGLGLSITQAIVQGHGGSIRVSSELGSGSCFIVSLPTAPFDRGRGISGNVETLSNS